MPILAITLLGSALIGLAIVVHRSMQQRRSPSRFSRLKGLAESLGCDFEPGENWIDTEHFRHLPMFSKGWDHVVRYTMSRTVTVGGRPFPLRMGDFLYQCGDEHKPETRVFSYVLVQLPFAGVPNTLIRREGVLDRLEAAVGLSDINFESAEFSRAYHVESESKRFAFDLINGRMMECLLFHKPWRVEIREGFFIVSDGQSLWSLDEFRDSYETVLQCLESWPSGLSALLEAGRWLDEDGGDT